MPLQKRNRSLRAGLSGEVERIFSGFLRGIPLTRGCPRLVAAHDWLIFLFYSDKKKLKKKSKNPFGFQRLSWSKIMIIREFLEWSS